MGNIIVPAYSSSGPSSTTTTIAHGLQPVEGWGVALLPTPTPTLLEDGHHDEHGLWFRTGPGNTTSGTTPVIKIRAKKSCGSTTTTMTPEEDINYLDDAGYLYDTTDPSNEEATIQGLVFDTSQIQQEVVEGGSGEKSYLGFTFVDEQIQQNSEVFTPPRDTSTSDDDDDTVVVGTIQFCIEIGLYDDNDNSGSRRGYAQAMFTYQMMMEDTTTTRLIEYTTIQTCPRHPGGSSEMCVKTYKPQQNNTLLPTHHQTLAQTQTQTQGKEETPSSTARRSKKSKTRNRSSDKKYYYKSPAAKQRSNYNALNLQAVARVASKKQRQAPPVVTQLVRDLQSSTDKTVLVYEFPPTETNHFVHGLCVMGASSVTATCSDADVTYTQVTSQTFGNGIKLWGDRNYIVDRGVTASDQCMGGIYLQPSKHKHVDKGSTITLTAVAATPNVDITVCGIVEYGHLDRHGDWQNDLPALGFTTSASAFDWGSNNAGWQMKAYCKAMPPTMTALEAASAAAKKDGEMCFFVENWQTLVDVDGCCFCIVPPNDVFDVPKTLDDTDGTRRHQRRLGHQRRRLGQPQQEEPWMMIDDGRQQEEHQISSSTITTTTTTTNAMSMSRSIHRALQEESPDFFPSPDPYVSGLCSQACERVNIPLTLSNTEAPTTAPTTAAATSTGKKNNNKRRRRR